MNWTEAHILGDIEAAEAEMSDDLVKRLRDRAKQDRLIQANNEAVATALMGQRLLFDQGHRSPSNTYAVRLAMDHDNCARQDAKLAADWDEAADCIEALTEQLKAARADAKEAEAYAEELAGDQVDLCRQLMAAEDTLAKAVEALRKLHHAVCGETGFAACVRLDSGLAYPWPALDEADEMTRATLAEIEGEKG
jgi:hypothetical protein